MTWIYVPGKQHSCRTPGPFERLFKKCRPGAIWRCDDCAQDWEWRLPHDVPTTFLNWHRL